MSEAAVAPSAPVEQAPSPEAASPSDTQAQQAHAAQQKKKMKIDGREVAVDTSALSALAKDLGVSEDEFLRDYGTSASTTRKSQEVAKLRKELEQSRLEFQEMINDLKSDPEQLWNIAQQLGHDPEKIAEEKLWKKIQYEKLSPEAKQAMAEKQRADAAERKLKEREESEAKQRAKVAAQAAEQEIENDVLGVLEASKLTADPRLIRRVAEIYESYILAKNTKPSKEYVLDRLRQSFGQERAAYVDGSDVEEFVKTHPEFTKKLQAHLVSKARTGNLPSISPSGSAPSTQQAKKEKKISIDEFFKNL